MNTLMRYTPFVDLRREVDRLFEDLTRNGENGNGSNVWSPRTDISETESEFLVQMDVPGLKKEDIQINFHNGQLSVTGERRVEQREEKQNFHRIERAYGRFSRLFTLPDATDLEHISATFEDGVLTIRIPKAEESKPRRIEIQ